MADYTELISALRLCVKYQKAEDALENARQAADAIEDLEYACNRYEKDYKALCEYLPKWQPVTERLPHEELLGIRVLCCLKNKDVKWVDVRLFMNGKFHHPKGQKGKVTHWQPLPEPPKEVQT